MKQFKVHGNKENTTSIINRKKHILKNVGDSKETKQGKL